MQTESQDPQSLHSLINLDSRSPGSRCRPRHLPRAPGCTATRKIKPIGKLSRSYLEAVNSCCASGLGGISVHRRSFPPCPLEHAFLRPHSGAPIYDRKNVGNIHASCNLVTQWKSTNKQEKQASQCWSYIQRKEGRQVAYHTCSLLLVKHEDDNTVCALGVVVLLQQLLQPFVTRPGVDHLHHLTSPSSSMLHNRWTIGPLSNADFTCPNSTVSGSN